LNLPSDASYRFERGVDPGMVLSASQRATELIREIAGGTPAKEVGAAGKVPANPDDVSLSYEKCDRVVGIGIKPKTVDEILTRFGLSKTNSKTRRQTRLLKAVKSNESESTWKIPSYRRDLQRDVDLIEEIVRAYGVNKVPGTDRSRFTASSAADHSHDLESALRERLNAYGLWEVRTSKLIPRSAISLEVVRDVSTLLDMTKSAAPATAAIELRNPLSEDHVALRPSLIAGLLAVLERNIRAGTDRVAVFELGRVFVPPKGEEERHLGILVTGELDATVNWNSLRKVEDPTLGFFDAKGMIESLGVKELSFNRISHPQFWFAVEIHAAKKRIGFLGQINTSRRVFIAELVIDGVTELETSKKFREIPKFPSVTRDIAMFVSDDISHEKALSVIQNPIEPLLESVQVFDCFPGTKGGEERKSLAYRLTYRDRSRTLTSEEVSAVHAKIRERLQRDLGAELRE
jgi:phenylalanyl-tRNA synthetase beta chain